MKDFTNLELKEIAFAESDFLRKLDLGFYQTKNIKSSNVYIVKGKLSKFNRNIQNDFIKELIEELYKLTDKKYDYNKKFLYRAVNESIKTIKGRRNQAIKAFYDLFEPKNIPIIEFENKITMIQYNCFDKRASDLPFLEYMELVNNQDNRKIVAIWAQDETGLIGKNNKLPWKVPEDLKHFKNITKNKTVVMGRKTFESIGNQPLPNRKNIILTRDSNYKATNGILVFNTIQDVLEYTLTDLYIIGGKEIYKGFAPYFTHLIKSNIKGEYNGDTYIDNIFDYSMYHKIHEEQISKNLEVEYYERNK